ncbi:MAG: TIGR00725 family protein [Candidatus Omnitrophota bacterium]|nr:TIGR00725 family protein [Candidatus Omnitrophota bacterium]
MKNLIIGVIGGHTCTKEVELSAHNLGKSIAKVGYKLVCGGLGGVMNAVCKGVKEENGVTIGIIPSYDKNDANEYVDIVIPTGLGYARNVLVVQTADVVIALPGEYGTLSEIAYALQFNKPVISLGSWDIKGVIQVKNVEEAMERLKSI